MTETGVLDVELAVRRGDSVIRAAFRAAAGRPLAVVGPNGAGKSSLVSALAGVTPADQGRIRLGARTLLDTAAGVVVPAEGRRIGVVFQDLLLFPHLDVRDNVAFGARAAGSTRPEAREAAQAWLERFGIGELARRRPAELSGGQAQRVALARSLAAEPEALLLDEPLSALDVEVRDELRADLAGWLRGFAGPVVVVTHDADDLLALADDVLVLERGVVTQRGTPAQLEAAPATPYVRRLLAR